jgi:hypothetical protein
MGLIETTEILVLLAGVVILMWDNTSALRSSAVEIRRSEDLPRRPRA